MIGEDELQQRTRGDNRQIGPILVEITQRLQRMRCRLYFVEEQDRSCEPYSANRLQLAGDSIGVQAAETRRRGTGCVRGSPRTGPCGRRRRTVGPGRSSPPAAPREARAVCVGGAPASGAESVQRTSPSPRHVNNITTTDKIDVYFARHLADDSSAWRGPRTWPQKMMPARAGALGAWFAILLCRCRRLEALGAYAQGPRRAALTRRVPARLVAGYGRPREAHDHRLRSRP